MQKKMMVTVNRENNIPAFRMENNGVEIIVTFREQAGERDVKGIILELLTGAYERRIGEKAN